MNILKPGKENSFKSYCDNIFSNFVNSEKAKVERVDVIFDTYRKASLKGVARLKQAREFTGRLNQATLRLVLIPAY